MNIVERNIDKLIKLCKKYKVTKLYVFGSIITENFTKESDIDLLVTFDDIDLLEEKAIKNPFFKKSINNSKELIYG